MDILLIAGLWLDGSAWDDAVPELAHARHLDYADIDFGHWPMFTQPAELGRLLAEAADGA